MIAAAKSARPIETAPRDGTEVWLVSVQYPARDNPGLCIPQDYKIISIHNGYWCVAEELWKLGEPDFDIQVGDNCATHWMPKDAILIEEKQHDGRADSGDPV
jgi:hypothetical protein